MPKLFSNYNRWSRFFDTLRDELNGAEAETLDYYAMEEPWTLDRTPYSSEPEGDCIDVAREVFTTIFD